MSVSQLTAVVALFLDQTRKHTAAVVWHSGNGQPFYNPQHFCAIYSLKAFIQIFNDGSVWDHVVQDRPCVSEPDILGKLDVFEGEILECVSVVMWMDTVRCRAAALSHTLILYHCALLTIINAC